MTMIKLTLHTAQESLLEKWGGQPPDKGSPQKTPSNPKWILAVFDYASILPKARFGYQRI